MAERWSLVWRWFQQLPDDAIRTCPMTAIGRFNVALARGDFASSSQWIEAAEAALDAVPPDLQPTVQDVFIEAHKGFRSIRNGASVKRWLGRPYVAVAPRYRSTGIPQHDPDA